MGSLLYKCEGLDSEMVISHAWRLISQGIAEIWTQVREHERAHETALVRSTALGPIRVITREKEEAETESPHGLIGKDIWQLI